MRTTISIPDKLHQKAKQRVEEDGFLSMNDYVVSLVREDTKNMMIPEVKVDPQQHWKDGAIIPPQFIQSSPLPLQHPILKEAILVDAPVRIPQTPPPQPLHPKTPPRNPNAPDPYLVYGGKCQYKNINAGNIMCMYSAAQKLSVAQNQTGEQPDETQYQDVYLCPDHSSEVSHRSGFFVK